jgi:O-antigen/teichoic acid export membrane protein
MLSSRAMNILRLTEKPYYYLAVSFVAVFVSFFCNYYYIKVLDFGITGVFLSLLIASFVQLVFLVPVLISNFKVTNFSLSVLKKLLFFALPFFPASMFFVLIEVSDRWMLGWLGSLSDVGLYGAGYKIGSLILMVVLAFNLNWQPFYLKKNQSSKSLETIGSLFIVVLIFITTLLSSLWPILIKINVFNFYVVGESFWLGGKVVPVVAISYLFYGVFILQMPSIYIKNKQNWIPVIWGAGLLVNFTSNYFLIQKLGFIGAAYSTLLTYMFMAIFLVLKNRLWFPLSYSYMNILKVSLASLLVYII